jgi:hypothetical protein
MDPVTLAKVTTLEIVQHVCHLNTLGCSACKKRSKRNPVTGPGGPIG